MNPDFFPDNLGDWVKTIGGIISIFGIGSLIAFYQKIAEWWRIQKGKTSFKKSPSRDIYPETVLENTFRYYIMPDCQSLDPAGSEEPRKVLGTREPLFSFVDRALTHATDYRYIILLADSGMGKTSFMINYFARNIRDRRRSFETVLLPLGIPDVKERVDSIENKAQTILLLDALDEDTNAVNNHVERLKELVSLTKSFKKVLITCRTQFFPKDEEIPVETGIIKIGQPRRAGESAEYYFHKIYLSPFTDKQVSDYLKKRYSFWQQQRRKKAFRLIEKIPNLIVRPMLLAHIRDLVEQNLTISSTAELYEEMVQAWLIREEGVFPDIKQEPLRQFSEKVAFNIYINRKERGSERIPKADICALARQWNIPLEDWQLTGRSLLNRNADGEYKFAHRSIMEYLFIKHLLTHEPAAINFLEEKEVMTDQMMAFYRQFKDGEQGLNRAVSAALEFRVPELKKEMFDRQPIKTRIQLLNQIDTIPQARLEVHVLADMEFCLISGGPFYMGSTDSDAKEHLNEKLTNEYWLSRYPVTVGQYKQFLDQSGHKPTDKDCIKDPDNRPVRFITWHEARQFGEWLTALARSNGWISDQQIIQLPSEAEWEKAARGGLTIPANPVIEPLTSIKLKAAEGVEYKDNPWPRRVYPWGDEADTDKANYDATGIGTTSPVGCFPDGASPYGCEEMSGNVWEWTRSIYQKYPYDPTDGRESLALTGFRVLRGGAFNHAGDDVRSAFRGDYDPDLRDDDVGFRVCLSPIFNSGL